MFVGYTGQVVPKPWAMLPWAVLSAAINSFGEEFMTRNVLVVVVHARSARLRPHLLLERRLGRARDDRQRSLGPAVRRSRGSWERAGVMFQRSDERKITPPLSRSVYQCVCP